LGKELGENNMPRGVYIRIKPGSNKGRKFTEEHKNKIRISNIGKKRSKETIEKIRASKTGVKQSKETIEKRLFSRKGYKHSEETKRKIGNSNKKNVLSEERKRMFYELTKKQIGEKHPRWKGGYQNRLFLNRQRRVLKSGNGGRHTLSDWEILKKRFKYLCVCCNKTEPEITLSEDHIIPLSIGGTDNIENIQPLCRSCNSKKRNNIIKYAVYKQLITTHR
jgi:5-methylcytosine-specific restriction endonuclease McrA